ncbi:MAG: hypothetical protein E5X48_04655 [Mesorhizobium sp.]|uniref:hypothetical protein n=1 Tax=Mesorhizobium sp. TaxID=1871066 RepID=UPI001221E876|nr:hypothetical protein [Mesorhizobium sp.]TIQ37693.1 MAG: hypothetical protein E5X48_04655 [Mesorhizobium sp.]
MFNDVDILFTTDISVEGLPDLHRAICSKMSDLSISINCRVDFTLLTLDEFSTKPLRDHAELVKLA